MTAITELSLAELASAIRRREISSVEATRASIEGLDTHGRSLLAVVDIDSENALALAETLDREIAAGEPRGPLHGVPLAHKDMYYRAGRPCVSGTRLRQGFVPEVTAAALTRLDAAGALDIARLNMVEFALGVTGLNAHTGHPHNPWKREHITGGSSSGPAAAVAARLTWASLGSDTGGSIRVPAACTGLVGLKPTYGRVSRFGALPLSQSLDHIGPLTRTARDTAILLSVLAGHDERDALTSRRPVDDYERALDDGLGGDLRGVRIGFAERPSEVEVAEEILVSLEQARSVLAARGAELVEIDLPPLEPFNAARRCLMLTEAAAHHLEMVRDHRDLYLPETLARLIPGYAIDAVTYLRAASIRSAELRRFMSEVMDGLDMLQLPALTQPVPRIADIDTGGDERFVKLSNEIGHYIYPFNYLGLPAISIPIEPTRNGLPMGMQLVGRPFAEALLLRTAHQVDLETNYSDRRPTL